MDIYSKKGEIIKSFKRRYKKNLAVANKAVEEKKAIFGGTLWSGCSGLPWFLSFDLEETLNYIIDHTNWRTHPDLARLEVISFGENPKQETVGYLYGDYLRDGGLYL
jgi:hypothetical protein